jgi:integrase
MDVDTAGSIWRWKLPKHKNTWRGHERVVLIGPKAQAILKPYLRRAPQLYCFSPAESERERCWWRRRNRKSPMTPSQAARKPKAEPMCKPKSHYSTSSIRCAVQRACRRAKVPEWATMQLRHNAATEAREHLGLDAAQARLGHRTANITQVYAAVTQKRGEEVAKLTYYGLYALQHRGQEAANVHLPTDDLAHRFCEQCRRHAFPQLADPPQLNIRTGHL